jgi:hypothetical protein
MNVKPKGGRLRLGSSFAVTFFHQRFLVKLAPPEGGGLSAHRTALRDSHRCQVGNPYSIPGLARAFGTILRATRSEPRTAWARAKPLPLAGSNPSDATRSNALRTCPGVCGLDRIETTLLDETSQEGRILARLSFRPETGETVGSKSSCLLCVCAIHVAELRRQGYLVPSSICRPIRNGGCETRKHDHGDQHAAVTSLLQRSSHVSLLGAGPRGPGRGKTICLLHRPRGAPAPCCHRRG